MEQQNLSRAERQALKAKRQRKRQIIRRIKVGTGLCFVLAVVLYLLCALVFFKINTISVLPAQTDNVQASTYYSDEEIIKVTGVNAGDSLVLVSKNEIKETIETLLPYIGNVKVKRSYPSTLKIIVEDTNAFFALDQNGVYTLFNRDFKVLGTSDYIPDGCARLSGVNFTEMTSGCKAVFEDTANEDRLNILIVACESAGIENITKYDLTNIANVRIVINSRITLILGTITELEDKLTLGLKTIEAETENNKNAHIIIDITDPDRSYVRDDSSPIEENSTQPDTTIAETTEKSDNDANIDANNSDDIVAVG